MNKTFSDSLDFFFDFILLCQLVWVGFVSVVGLVCDFQAQLYGKERDDRGGFVKLGDWS